MKKELKISMLLCAVLFVSFASPVMAVPDYVGVAVGDAFEYTLDVDYDANSDFTDESLQLDVAIINVSAELDLELSNGVIVLISCVGESAVEGIGLDQASMNYLNYVLTNDTYYNDDTIVEFFEDGLAFVINLNAQKSYSWTDENNNQNTLEYNDDGVWESGVLWINDETGSDGGLPCKLTITLESGFNIPGFSPLAFGLISFAAIIVILKKKK